MPMRPFPLRLSPEQIATVLKSAQKDRSPMGLRDYAILQLLSTYGLRAGEITRLRLDDIDWRAETLRIRHSKTGAQSLLPLMEAVGEALIDYLRHGRPKTDVARNLHSHACALSSAVCDLQRSSPTNGGSRRKAERQTRSSHLPACAGRQPAASIRAAEGYRRRAGSSIGGCDDSVSETGHGRPARDCPGDSGTGGALMKTWPDTDGSTINRYLRQLRLRCPTSSNLLIVRRFAASRKWSADISAHPRR